MMKPAKYLLLDRGTINGHRCENAALQLCQATKDNRPDGSPFFSEEFFATPPKPWEVRYDNGYPCMFYDEDAGIYRLYYTLFTHDTDSSETPLSSRPAKQYTPMDTRVTSVCYAFSHDGITWEKPELGLVEFEGSSANNIVMRNAHGTCVLLDRAEPDPARRYKLMTKIEYSHRNHYMAVAFSADGIHFSEPRPWPRYNPQADTYNFVFRDPATNRFVLITRIWKNGVRIAAKCESSDFLDWSEPVEIARGDGFADQVYSMPVFPYENIYLGLASIYHDGNRCADNFDTVDLTLAFSTKLDHFDRVEAGASFIPRGPGRYPDGVWDCGCIYASTPVEIGDRLYFYYMGGNGQHTNYRETSFGRAWIRKDRFAGYEAVDPSKESVITLAPANFFGSRLKVLADVDTDAGGWLRCELMDARGARPVEGFAPAKPGVQGADGWIDIAFEGGALETLGPKEYALRFTYSHAKLFALEGDLRIIKRD